MAKWKRVAARFVYGAAIGIGVFVTLFGGQPAAQAGTPDRPDVVVDGELLRFDTQPLVYQNRTLVPMRMIFESLGADVSWEAATSTAVARLGNVTLRLPIGSPKVMKNGTSLQLDVPAQLVNGRTMVPVRFIAEAFGSQVDWDPKGKVTIKSTAAPVVRIISGDATVTDQQLQQVRAEVYGAKYVEQLEALLPGQSFRDPVWLYLTNSPSGFLQQIEHFEGGSGAERVANVADGLAYGSHVLIPLHKAEPEEPDDLNMVIAHELVHVLLNQNTQAGHHVPDWLHESLAWKHSLDVVYNGQPDVLRHAFDGNVRDYILNVVKKGQYIPLISTPGGTLDALQDGYNVELQDYLAYEYALERFGAEKLATYVQRELAGQIGAFRAVLGLSLTEFDREFKAYLQGESQRRAQGAEVTFRVRADYGGKLFLQGSGEGEGPVYQLQVQPGQHTVRIYEDGRIEGVPATRYGNSEEDRDTAFLMLSLDRERTEFGVQSDGGGFFFQQSFGEYFLGRPWVEPADGTDPVHRESNQLLGVEVLAVKAL